MDAPERPKTGSWERAMLASTRRLEIFAAVQIALAAILSVLTAVLIWKSV